jgi:hypothetical protein
MHFKYQLKICISILLEVSVVFTSLLVSLSRSVVLIPLELLIGVSEPCVNSCVITTGALRLCDSCREIAASEIKADND